jgi:biotin operon repressor
MKNLKIKVKSTYHNYLEVINGISKLTSKEITLLTTLHKFSIDKIESKHKKLLGKSLGISVTTINLMINKLHKKGVFIKEEHGVYTLSSLFREVSNLNIEFNG